MASAVLLFPPVMGQAMLWTEARPLAPGATTLVAELRPHGGLVDAVTGTPLL